MYIVHTYLCTYLYADTSTLYMT